MEYWSFVWFNAQVEWIHMSCRPNDGDDSFYCLVQDGIRLLDAQVLPQSSRNKPTGRMKYTRSSALLFLSSAFPPLIGIA